MAGFDISLQFMTAMQGGSALSCFLRAESFAVNQTRSPSIISLPQQNASNRGGAGAKGTGIASNIAIDFGVMQEQLSISGKIPDDDTSDLLGSFNSVSKVMSRVRRHWVESPSVITNTSNRDNTGLVRVTVVMASGEPATIWDCTVIRSSWRRGGGNMWWEYDLLLGVVFYPAP